MSERKLTPSGESQEFESKVYLNPIDDLKLVIEGGEPTKGKPPKKKGRWPEIEMEKPPKEEDEEGHGQGGEDEEEQEEESEESEGGQGKGEKGKGKGKEQEKKKKEKPGKGQEQDEQNKKEKKEGGGAGEGEKKEETGEGAGEREKEEGEGEKKEGEGEGEGEEDKDKKEEKDKKEKKEDEGEGEGKGKEETEEGGKEGEEGEEEKNPWKKQPIKPNPFDAETIKQFIEAQQGKEEERKTKEEEDERKSRLSPEDRAKIAQKEHDRAFIKDHPLHPEMTEREMLEVVEEYRAIEESIEPYKDELARVFEELMQHISKQIVLEWEEGFRSGRLNIDRFINKYAGYLQEGAPVIQFNDLDVFDQKEFTEKLRLFPEKIRLRFVLDGSNSMKLEDGARIFALKQITVLILESLKVFEFLINYRFKLKNPIRVDTEIRMYGSQGNSRIVKHFSEEKNYDQEEDQAERLKSFTQINYGYGYTCDAEPWWQIDQSLDNPNYLDDLKTGRAQEFSLEVTDGGSNQPSGITVESNPALDTRNAIEAVNEKGLITRGFQIGNPTSEEKNIFDQIWGKDGERVDHPSKLAPAMAKLVADEIRKLKLKIVYEGGEED